MKALLILARAFSALFRPIYYPTAAFVILFTCSYMVHTTPLFKVWVLTATFLFTVGLPVLSIRLFRRSRGLSALQLRHRRHRVWPYIFSLFCYTSYLHLIRVAHLPRLMMGIIVVAMAIQGVCLLVNMRWKISLHAAGAGGLVGALVAYGQVFAFNPVWWLCGAILLCGVVMTCRIILRQHTLCQVTAGAAVGIVCGYLGIIYT